jgi:lysophospholipid acyltransferase (LPLAT)-like uncharacterized protein
MSQTRIEQSTGQRFLVSLPVHAEWKESTGQRVVTQGRTENIGPAGALVILERLPAVGSRIHISVQGARGSQVETDAEVVRLVRDLQQPLASISVIKSKEEWRGRVWEAAKILAERSAKEEADEPEMSVN